MNRYYREKDYIHYSNCHEDVEILYKSIGSNRKRALSIASAGDNSLALLTQGFEEIIVFDINPNQLNLVKLKATAIKYLSYEETLIFLGIKNGDSLTLYRRIRHYLEVETRNYFDNHLFLIDQKRIVNSGRFDYYLQLFGRKILPMTNSRKTIELFMNAPNLPVQWEIYQKKFNNRRWRFLFRCFFSKRIMKKIGRDKEYFKYCEDNLAQNLRKRVEKGFKNTLNLENPYLRFVVYGKFDQLPSYLEQTNFYLIKKNIDRLHFVLGDLATINLLGIHFDFFNLSDIFEYMSIEDTRKSENIIADNANNNAIVVFWNMIVPREFNGAKFKPLDTSKLFLKDRAIYYQRLNIYEVKQDDN